MSTRIRSEISRSKLYHLPKHRQLELVHFCLQYPMWRQMLSAIDGYSSGRAVHKVPDKDGYAGSLVEDAAGERARLSDKMAMVEASAKAAADAIKTKQNALKTAFKLFEGCFLAPKIQNGGSAYGQGAI